MSKWTTADIPDQSGRVAVITGANTGLGFETAAALAEKGAHVVLAVRNLDKGKDAAVLIQRRSPHADIALQELDLTSLESTRAAAEQLRADHDRIDLLINNAGVMYTPKGKHQGRLRAAVRHQPPGPLRPHRPTAGPKLLPGRRFPGRDGQQRRPPHPGRYPLRRLAMGAQLQPGPGLRAGQAGQSAVHL